MIATLEAAVSAGRRVPRASLLFGLAAVLIYLLPAASAAFEYHRGAIEHGQLWRLFTCHWTHLSLDHLLWDAAVFVALAAWCERDAPRRFWTCLGASALLIPVSVWILLPDLETYRGLSGIDSALFALLAIRLLLEKMETRQWGWVAAVVALLAGFVCKTAFEAVTGQAVFVDSAATGMIPVPLAHAVGAAVGIVTGIWPERTKDR